MTRPRIAGDPFFQALAALVFMGASLALLWFNDQGTDCFFAGGCLGNTMLVLAGVVTVLGVAAAGAWVARLGFEDTPAPASGFGLGEALPLAAVLGLAGVLRLGLLGSYPAWLDYDTAQNGWIALTLWEQLPTHGIQPVLLDWATGNETAYIYLVGASLKLLGISVEALRLPSALVGTLTVAAIYLLGRVLLSARVGLAAAFFAALCPWHILHSRMATRPILTALFVALGLLLLQRGLVAQSRRRAWAWLVGCGLLLGAGLHGYEAFRLFPLVVAAVLVWTRWRQQQLRRGLLELVVVATCAFLVTLPIFIFALRHPEAYMEHVSANSMIYAMQEAGSPMPLLTNLVLTLGFMVFALPSGPHQDYPQALPLLLLSPLFLAGLGGLLLARKPDAGQPQAPSPPRLAQARMMLLLTLVIMAAPFLLARFSNLAPRRYMGEMVPFYLLAGAAAVGLLRGLARRVGTPGAVVAAALGALAMLSSMPTVAGALAERMEHHRAPRAERILRWCLTLTDEQEIYLAPDLVGQGYLPRFFLKHPQIHQLPTAWPLPEGPLERDVMLVSRGEPWWGALVKQFMATRELVTLDLPLSEPTAERLTVYWVSRRELRKHRLTAKQARKGFDEVSLLAPGAGAYSFRVAPGSEAELVVGGSRAESGKELTVALAAGLTAMRFRPKTAAATLQWRPPGAEDFRTLPAQLLWRLPATPLPSAPPVVRTRAQTRVVAETTVPVFAAFEHSRSLQDLARGPDGQLYIVDLDRYPVKRWTRRGAVRLEPLLKLRNGEPLTLTARYDPESFKALSLAVSRQGFFLLDRAQRSIQRFTPSGLSGGQLPRSAVRPVDLTATDEALYVADPGSRAVLEYTASGNWEGKTFARDLDPVALQAAAGRLALLDRRRHQLRVLSLESGAVLLRVQLGQVNRTMRVSLAVDGSVAVTDPIHQRVLLLDPTGRLLAPGGDPRQPGSTLLEKTADVPSRVLLDTQKRELIYMGRSKSLVVLHAGVKD